MLQKQAQRIIRFFDTPLHKETRLIGLVVSVGLLIVIKQASVPFFRMIWYGVAGIITFPPILSILKALNGVSPVKLTNISLYAKAIVSIVYLVFTLGIIWLYFQRWRHLAMAARLMGMFFLVVLALNIVGHVTHNHAMLTTARYSLDYLFGGFMLIFLIPVLLLMNKTDAPEAKQAPDNQAPKA